MRRIDLMKPRRHFSVAVVPVAVATVLALVAAPVGAAGVVAITDDTTPVPPATPSTTVVPDTTVVPEIPEPSGLIQLPPPVNQEIAAILENERRAAAVEEAKAVAAVEQATADAVVATAQSALDVANAKVAESAAQLAATQAAYDVVVARVDQAKVHVDSRKDRATEIGVEMYTATGSTRDPRMTVTIALLADDGVPDASTAQAYRDVVAEAAFGDLQSARRAVERIKKELHAAQEVVDGAAQALKEVDAAAKLVQADLIEAQKAAATVAKAGAKQVKAAEAQAPSLKSTELTGGLGILGDPLVSANDLAAFVRQTGRAHPSIDLDALAATYIAEGKAEGVRSDVAWVQSIIETGWFSFKGSMVEVNDYNYAGIGACDSCSRGIIFNNMTDGVRSQVQLLRTYATKGLKTTDLANPPPRLVPEKSYVRGCCGTWMRLSGVWATGPGYGIKILSLYNQLISFAAARRAR